jgi:glycosyltransferase involved in cell wall biosynthesis
VVVPTRNRAHDVTPCVQSILSNTDRDFELLVVDQSDSDSTRDALRAFGDDCRFRYVQSGTRGVSRSRNVGIQSTTGPIVAFTDDDCRVPQNWIARIKEVFGDDAEAAAVFGRVVVPAEVDGNSRYAAKFEPTTREYQHAFPEAGVPWGIGANMAFRRSVFDAVGVFDPLLGPGAKFPAAEEYDMTIRTIAAGMKVVNAAEVCVLHLGVREREAASALVRGYGVAIGAALTKHVRLGTKHGGRLLARWVAFHGGTAMLNVATGKRPTNLRFVAALLWGVARAYGQPLDATRFVYEEPS